MNATNTTEAAPADLLDQALLELELRIARRADELVNETTRLRDRHLECWMRAEREVLADGQRGATRALDP